MVAGSLSAASSDSKKEAPVCRLDTGFHLDFLQPEQTRWTWQPKRPKVFAPAWGRSKSRRLQPVVTTLFNIHTREAVPVFTGTLPPAQVLEDIFRCRGFNDRHPVDSRLVKTVIAAAVRFNAPRVEIISAYRAPKFNDSLLKKGRRVALNSHHTKGEAIDFALSTARAKQVGAYVWKHFDGGVGIYAADDFVHIDVGPKRRWTMD
jgi:uncharacterized protein YcbK (DUF882 family)